MLCKNCGTELNNATTCPKCGTAVEVSDKKWLYTLLFCWFFGYLGVHRFYTGKTGTAIAMLLTCGGCGIWTLYDLIMILLGNFTDNEGRPLQR